MNVCYGSPDEFWLQDVEVEALETLEAASQVFHTLCAAEISGGALVKSHEMLRDVVRHQGFVNVLRSLSAGDLCRVHRGYGCETFGALVPGGAQGFIQFKVSAAGCMLFMYGIHQTEARKRFGVDINSEGPFLEKGLSITVALTHEQAPMCHLPWAVPGVRFVFLTRRRWVDASSWFWPWRD